jgi:CENP-B N-terminal DNA-binding domain.
MNGCGRFWTKVDKNGPTMPGMQTPCWVWTAYTNRNGYGKFRLSGRIEQAHRLAWEIANGTIPEGMDALHRCDNPPCVRDEHLFLGTNADNVADRDAKGRQARGDRHGTRQHPESRPRGERAINAKLTEAKVRSIFRLSAEGHSQRELARDFGVSKSNVRDVLARKKWAHVQLEIA